MKHKHKPIDYKPIKAKFLMLGLRQFNDYPNIWSLSPLIELNTECTRSIICEDTYIRYYNKFYFADNTDELYTAITDTVKKYTDGKFT